MSSNGAALGNSADNRVLLSVHDTFFALATNRPDHIALRITTGDGDEEFTYARLAERVSDLSAGAFARVPRGERVVLAVPGGVDFVAGLLAACTVGAIAVPLPFSARDPHRWLDRAEHILLDCAPHAVFTSPDLIDTLAAHRTLGALPIRTPDDPPTDRLAPHAATPHTAALLQYSSGSTGNPRGVVDTHACVLRQARLLERMWACDSAIHTVSWLPLYHDMGLFWGVLGPLLTGGCATLIPPEDFARDPRLWLRTVSRLRGNWIGAPDFGYRHAVAAFDAEEVATLDLRCLRMAVNGAEPVRAETVRAFAEHFAGAGLSPHAMSPAYGLAEAGLAVSGSLGPRRVRRTDFCSHELLRGHAVEVDRSRPHRTLVGCGDATFGWDVRIVDPDSAQVVADGGLGEIWVAGPGLPSGYWGDEAATTATFRAHTAEGAGPFLRTGDIGFRHDGDLYLCGRYRDLIIVAGTNHFPHDIEATVTAAGCAVRRSCAVQPDPGSGTWILVAETDRPSTDLADLSRILHRHILAEHRTAPDRILWVPPRSLPSTTSGKIRRAEIGRRATRGELPVLWETGAGGGVRAACAVSVVVADMLGIHPEELDEDTDLVGLGLTSQMTARFAAWARTRGAGVDIAALHTAPTVRAWRALAEPDAGQRPSPAATKADHLPTTPLQRAYWVGRDPAQPLGGVGCQAYAEFHSPALDIDRLRDAVDGLHRRHPMLRSHFPTADRCVVRELDAPVTVTVHRVPDTASLDDHLAGVRQCLRTHHFDPVAGDCLRFELTVAPGRTVLHLAVDLLVADVTGIGILVRDLAALYRGEQLLPPAEDPFTATPAPAGPTTPSSGPIPEPPQLPLLRETNGPEFRRIEHRLGPDTTHALDAACRAGGVTRAALLSTCYEIVLRRWSTSPEFTVTVTTTARTPHTADTVGDFTRTLRHRSALPTGTPLAVLAATTRDTLRREFLAPDPLTDGHPASTVVFTYAADVPLFDTATLDTLGTIREMSSRTPQVVIDNQCCAIGAEVVLSWDVRTSCFPPGVAEDMFAAYTALVTRAAHRTWDQVVEPDLPAAARRAREDRNATDAPLPRGSLVDAFRARVSADPDRIAIRWAPDEYDRPPLPEGLAARPDALRYDELDRAARRLATALCLRHGPGSVIGIALPKGPAQAVAVLGTLMAGCVYLPISVDQPVERFHRIRRRSEMAGLVHDGRHAFDTTPQGDELAGHEIAAALRHDPREPVPVDPTRPAYIVYTSGSTGEPKGVVVSHTAALNTVLDVNRRNGITSEDSVLAVSALDFDLSVYDLFGPLVQGATVVTIAEGSRRDAFRWRDLIDRFAITIWNSVPGPMQMLLIAAGPDGDRFPSLRHVFLSGDWIPLDLPAALRTRAPRARLVAMGGATEAAIWSNEFVVESVDPAWPSIPYGFPLTNQRYRVVGPDGLDRPDHVAGELWIGGAGVAEGYHHDPDRTRARFRCDETGTRWYRTGDLGCYLPGGMLRFLGRMDHQVKIRGHRVECGEVEHVLLAHPSVHAAVVVAIRESTALGALVVTDVDPEGLRAFLAVRLPEYMRPRVYRRATRIPYTANGKVDRRAVTALLEEPVLTASGAATTPVRDRVARVWGEVLGVPARGLAATASFFAAGGDSLRATEVCGRLTAEGVLGAEVEALMTARTLADFADRCVIGDPVTDPVATPTGDVSAPFALTRLQQSYVLGAAGLRGVSRAPTALVVVLAAPQGTSVDLPRLHRVLTDCVAEFDMLRCRLDGEIGQVVDSRAEPVPIRIEPGLPDDPDALVRLLSTRDCPPGVPVLRCYATVPAPRHVALLIDYLGLDARSVTALVAAIRADYDGIARPVRIDPGADTFRRFTTLVEETGDERPTPAGPPRLPAAWSPDHDNSEGTGGFTRHSVVLDESDHTALRSAATAAGATPTALVLEAFTHTLFDHGSGDLFAVSIPLSHRPGFAPADREVLGNFTRLRLCTADYRRVRPGSAEAIAQIQRHLRALVGGAGDDTAVIARLRTAGGVPAYPVVFTSTLGMDRHEDTGLATVRTLTRTPGVALDCQIEPHGRGIRLSFDCADAAISAPAAASALALFEQHVRAHLSAEPASPPARTDGEAADDWPLSAAAQALAGLDRPGARPVLPRHRELVGRWRALPCGPAPDDDARAAGLLLSEIVTGLTSDRAVTAHPRLSPEALLWHDARVGAGLDDLAERVRAHRRTVGRPLRIVELGARTGLLTARLWPMLAPMAATYGAVEPDPILRALAVDRAIDGVHRIDPDQLAGCAPFDVVVCCATLHRLADPAALLRATPRHPRGWVWLLEHHTLTPAALISAAVLDPGLASAPVAPPERWTGLLAACGLVPEIVEITGPGVTVVAHPEPPASVRDTTSVPDGDHAARLLADLWHRHLGVRPGPDDDFFLLGGDSLTATRIYGELRALGYERVSLVDLFNHPVLRRLAEVLGPAHTPRASVPAPTPVSPTVTTYPLTPIQRAYASGRRPGYLLGGVAAHCYFEFETTTWDASRFESAVRALIRRHPGLRTTVADGVATVHETPLEPVVRLLDDVRATMGEQIIDLTRRPGLDIGVQVLTPGHALIGISMDNLLLDGASMMNVLAELDSLYADPTHIPPSPPLTFAHHVHRTRDTDSTEAQRYWLDRLAHLPPAPPLVTTTALARIDRPRFTRTEAVLDAGPWAGLTRRCRTEGVTPSAVVTAAYARVLAQWTNSDRFCLNVTLFDRDPAVPGIEEVLGDFTSLLLLECHVEATVTLWDHARALQRQLMTDMPHRGADAVWLQRELLRHHGRPESAMYPVVLTSGLGLRTLDTATGLSFGRQVHGRSQTPQTLLDFQVWQDGGALRLSWDHVTQAITPDTARRHLDELVEILRAAAPEDPAPTTARRITEICAQVLRRPLVDPEANFFQIGGDSVTATAVVERVQREVAPAATLRMMLAHPVIADFVDALAHATTIPLTTTDGDLEEGSL